MSDENTLSALGRLLRTAPETAEPVRAILNWGVVGETVAVNTVADVRAEHGDLWDAEEERAWQVGTMADEDARAALEAAVDCLPLLMGDAGSRDMVRAGLLVAVLGDDAQNLPIHREAWEAQRRHLNAAGASPNSTLVELVAGGRGAWEGWVELHERPASTSEG